MDKLELDDRVNRLEQRVSVLTALILAILVLGGISAAMMIFVRSEVRLSPPTPVMVTTAPTEAAAMHANDAAPSFIGGIDAEIRKADKIRSSGLIDAADFSAKKAKIIARPLGVTDFKDDMAVAKKLQNDGLITLDEYNLLKKKILELDKEPTAEKRW